MLSRKTLIFFTVLFERDIRILSTHFLYEESWERHLFETTRINNSNVSFRIGYLNKTNQDFEQNCSLSVFAYTIFLFSSALTGSHSQSFGQNRVSILSGPLKVCRAQQHIPFLQFHRFMANARTKRQQNLI